MGKHDTGSPHAPANKDKDKSGDDGQADAEDAGEPPPHLPTRTLPEIFGEDAVDPAGFEKAAAEAYRDPDLRPKREVGKLEAAQSEGSETRTDR